MCRKSLSLVSLVFALTAFTNVTSASKQAHDPTIADGATGVSPRAALGWSPGDAAIKHHIFLSNDFDYVSSGSLGVWQACQTATTYQAGPLLLGETYFWRVDEVGFSYWAPGQVWSFTVQDSLTVDDMESYSDGPDYIFDTWLDGAGNIDGVGGNGTGSVVDLEMTNVHGGAKSMCYGYNNSGSRRRRAYSEAKCIFDTPQRWAGTARALGLWFYGSANNDIEPMYVSLDDGSVSAVLVYGVLGEDPNDIKKEQWQEWNIDLCDFISAGLNLSNVVGIAVGFGDRTDANGQPGGRGVVYFDDIKLYPRRCVPKYAPQADFSGNCIVDTEDIKIMAAQWLESGSLLADMNLDNTVNFKDYAVLVHSWSEKRLWP